MTTSRQRIEEAYQAARVRGMLFPEQPRPDAEPQLPRNGLAGMPVTALALPPSYQRLLSESHILSVEMLCQLKSGDLGELGFPPAYVRTIDKKLGQLGLGLDMSGLECEAYSRRPHPSLAQYFPSFRVKAGTEGELPKPARKDWCYRPAKPREPKLGPTTAKEAYLEAKPADYIAFKFPSAQHAQRFAARVKFLFEEILKIDPEAREACTSNAEEMVKPTMLLPSYAKTNGDKIFPVAISPSAVGVLANFAPAHPALFAQLEALEKRDMAPPRIPQQPAATHVAALAVSHSKSELSLV